ncbi:hypothetical protein DAPPUDRAFT_25363, partial [Daphnia pulex]
VTSCIFTPDRSLLNHSHVVLFFANNETKRNDALPEHRQPHQRFVFVARHASIESDSLISALTEDDRIRYNFFNWTMTYRRDSDIVFRESFGAIKNAPELMDRGRKAKKIKLVTWFVSHCSTQIRREEYARQLGQYVPVDIFGNCSSECPYDCYAMLRAEYKFYLAFENSWCPDYVTEKFTRPLFHDAVPIVLGGADYSHFGPPHSYINARDFASPKALADYLILLNNSDALYASYFDWKKDFRVVKTDMSGWCDLCQLAHNDSLPSKVYPDIKRW